MQAQFSTNYAEKALIAKTEKESYSYIYTCSLTVSLPLSISTSYFLNCTAAVSLLFLCMRSPISPLSLSLSFSLFTFLQWREREGVARLLARLCIIKTLSNKFSYCLRFNWMGNFPVVFENIFPRLLIPPLSPIDFWLLYARARFCFSPEVFSSSFSNCFNDSRGAWSRYVEKRAFLSILPRGFAWKIFIEG